MPSAPPRQDSLSHFFALAVLTAVLVLPGVAGSAGTYLAVLAAILGGLIAVERRAFRSIAGNPGIQLFVLAFVLLAVAFAITTRAADDLSAIGDFLLLLVAIPAALLFTVARSERDLRRLPAFALLGACGSMLIALVELGILGYARAVGHEAGAILFANMAIMLGFLALTGLFVPNARLRWLYLAGPVIGGAAALLADTADAVTLFGLLSLVLLVFLVRLPDRRLALAAAGVTIAAAIAFISLNLMLHDPAAALARTGSDSLGDISPAVRASIQSGGWGAFLSSPIVGHGWWQRFASAAPYMTPEAAAHGLNKRTMHLYSDALNFASAAGIFGLLAYFAILAAPIVGVWQAAKGPDRTALLYAAVSLSAGFLAAGLTDSLFSFEQPKAFYCIVAAILIAWSRPPIVASVEPRAPSLFTISASGPATRR